MHFKKFIQGTKKTIEIKKKQKKQKKTETMVLEVMK